MTLVPNCAARSPEQRSPGAAFRSLRVDLTALVFFGILGLAGLPETLGAQETSAGAPTFGGLTSAIAGDGFVVLRWQQAVGAAESTRYRVFRADRPRKQDFAAPILETAPGVLSTRVAQLTNGEPSYFVVRAVDSEGRVDTNEVEWCATPNPVIYVNPAMTKSSGDGKTPETAFPSLGDAVMAAIALEGVNVYLAAGEYAERVFVFDGMTLVGGFDENFDLERHPGKPTVLRADAVTDMILVAPGQRPSCLYFLELDGAGVGARGVVADDCEVHLGRVSVHGFQRCGVQLRSGRDNDARILGFVQQCMIRENRGEGVSLEGCLDVHIVDSQLLENGQEGIEAEPMNAAVGEKTRLKIERCRIVANGGMGVDVEIKSLDPEQTGGRARLTVRDCTIASNADHGVATQIREGAARDARILMAHNELSRNRRSGLQLDCEGVGNVAVSHNLFRANGADGLTINPGTPELVYRVHHNHFEGNQRHGVLSDGGHATLIRHCDFQGNAQCALTGSSWMETALVRLSSNGLASEVDLLRGEFKSEDEPMPMVRRSLGTKPGLGGTNGGRSPGVLGGKLVGPVGPRPNRIEPSLETLGMVAIFPAATGSVSVLAWRIRFDEEPPKDLPIRLSKGSQPLVETERLVHGKELLIRWKSLPDQAAGDASLYRLQVQPSMIDSKVQPWSMDFRFELKP